MFKKILVAIDGSHAARMATLQAIELATMGNAEVKVIYVVDDSEPLLEVAYIDRRDLLRSMADHGRNALQAAASSLKAAGVRHAVELIPRPISRGAIAQTILKQAADWHADLVALGTHGRRGVARVVMGSVAQGVVCGSAKPVLLVHSDLEDES